MYFLVNASPLKPLDVVTINFAGPYIGHMMWRATFYVTLNPRSRSNNVKLCRYIGLMMQRHVQIQEVLPGGGGGPGLTVTSFFGVIFSPHLILQFFQRVSNGYFKENYNFPKFQRESKIFQGSNLFQGGGGGGPNAFFYRNPYNLWFSRGSGPPIPPLDPHLRGYWATFGVTLIPWSRSNNVFFL